MHTHMHKRMHTLSATNPEPMGHLLIAVRRQWRAKSQVNLCLCSRVSPTIYGFGSVMLGIESSDPSVDRDRVPRPPGVRPPGVRDYFCRHPLWDIVCGI